MGRCPVTSGCCFIADGAVATILRCLRQSQQRRVPTVTAHRRPALLPAVLTRRRGSRPEEAHAHADRGRTNTDRYGQTTQKRDERGVGARLHVNAHVWRFTRAGYIWGINVTVGNAGVVVDVAVDGDVIRRQRTHVGVVRRRWWRWTVIGYQVENTL